MIEKAPVLAIIPARGGSKGIIGKNLMKLAGKPILSFPIDFLLSEQVPVDILVSTDSSQIADLAITLGAEVHYRSPDLATDDALTEPVLKEALLWKEASSKMTYSYCVFVTATSLFRPKGILKRGLSVLEENRNIESYFAAQPTTKNYWYINSSGIPTRVFPWMEVYGSRQTRVPLMREDTGIFSLSRATVWRSGRRIGNIVSIESFDTPFSSIDLHDERDIVLAEAALTFQERNM